VLDFCTTSCKETTNLMHNLFLAYFVNLYMFLAYLGPSYFLYTIISRCTVNKI